MHIFPIWYSYIAYINCIFFLIWYSYIAYIIYMYGENMSPYKDFILHNREQRHRLQKYEHHLFMQYIISTTSYIHTYLPPNCICSRTALISCRYRSRALHFIRYSTSIKNYSDGLQRIVTIFVDRWSGYCKTDCDFLGKRNVQYSGIYFIPDLSDVGQ